MVMDYVRCYGNPRILWLLARCRLHSVLVAIDYELGCWWLTWSGLEADFATARKAVHKRFAELDAAARRGAPSTPGSSDDP
jgi:hypothetical protein